MQGTSLTKQERECKLYNEFDKFTCKKGESLHEYYLRFTLLLNDMNIYMMPLEQFQVNTKFLNTLPAEWSKFVTDVKLVKDLHTTNNSQHQQFVSPYQSSQYGSPFESQQYSINQSPTPHSITYPLNNYQTSVHHNVFSPSSSIPQIEYSPTVNQQSEFSQLDFGLTIPVFKHGDDPINAINHVMAFLSAVVTSRYPTTNNQLRNSSNPRQQATINNGREQVGVTQGNRGLLRVTTAKGKDMCPNNALNQERNGMIHDPGIPEAQAIQTVITHNAAYQVDDLDAYDSDCDELNTAKVALMANLSHYGLNALAEVHNHDNVNNNMINQAVQVMSSSEQSNVVNHSETEITNALILSVIEQLKTQVANCTKINLENKSVNDTLTVELERYKEQVKVLNEGQNVDLKSKDNILDSRAQSVEIDHLKQTLSEHLKENESLMQIVTLLKNNFKKEELKAQQLEPKVYVGDIIEKTNSIVIPDSEETLMLNSVISTEPTLSRRPTIVEVPKELPKVSMVNTSLKKLKHHLAGFDVVVKERTTPTAITEGSWGFEHTKACFRDEIIPFVKALKDLFNTFNQYLVDELSEVQNVFHQMEQAVEQHRLESKTFEVKMNQVLNENERLLEQVISKDIVNILVNSSVNIASVNVHECEKCLKLETELLNKKDFIEKEIYDKLFKSFTTLEKTLDSSLSQEKDTVIKKLKERIKSLSGKQNEDKIKKDLEEIETINIELDHRVTKLIAENEHLKQTYKQLYDSIKPACIRSKEQCDDLINQVNLRVKPSTSASGSQPSCNTKKDKIQQIPSSTQKNKVEAHPRKVKSGLKNKDCVVQSKGTAHVQHSKLNANLNINASASKITTTTEVPLRKPTALENETPKPVVTLVYSRKPRKSKTNVPISKSKVVQIVLWYLDSGCSKHMTRDRSQLTNFVNKFLGTVKFENDHVAKILRYGDYQIGNVTILRVYYVEGLGHNLFSVGQFCDLNLEVAFYMMASSPICLLSKASKTKSWLWHRCLSHLNFGAINHLARHGLVRGLPKLKFKKDHMCSAYAMGKSKKKPHKPKFEDTNQEKLYLLHMDLCGPMRVASINEKKYILVIVDDFSRFTWVKFLRSKDEAPNFIIKFLKMIQVRLKVPVRRIRTDNGTEFVNQTLREYYEKVGISHETSVARSPQQNGIVERHNRTLIEAAHTMLIYVKHPLFLWAEAVATACYTQNRSIVRLRHRKTPYELLHDKPPDLSFFYVFGALCYPTNDSDNLGKLQPKADIGIFIGYAATKKAFRIFNRHTRRIIETIHVDFDELTAMASERSSSGPTLHEMTPATTSSGIVDNPAPEVIAPIAEVVALVSAISTVGNKMLRHSHC
ncbi:retrovirus-related pol polyprotein from transposon TNT 1-94 [Tanacetum coccineum]